MDSPELQLKKLELKRGDVICLNVPSGMPITEAKAFVDRISAVEIPTGPHPFVIMCHGCQIDVLDDQLMRQAGWTRIENWHD